MRRTSENSVETKIAERPFHALGRIIPSGRLQVSRRTVYRWIKDGSLNAYQFGREYRITESDLKEFLERRRTRPK